MSFELVPYRNRFPLVIPTKEESVLCALGKENN